MIIAKTYRVLDEAIVEGAAHAAREAIEHLALSDELGTDPDYDRQLDVVAAIIEREVSTAIHEWFTVHEDD